MTVVNIICPECKEVLKPSQYATKSGFEDHFVCRNYPKCPKAEKEIMAEIIPNND